MNEQQARQFTEGLGNIFNGGWQLIKSAHDLGVPAALGVGLDEWVRENLGCYPKLEREERKAAVLELKEDGYTTEETEGILGGTKRTVQRDRSAPNGEGGKTQDVDKKENSKGAEGKSAPNGAPHVSKNSGENEWYTPPEFIEAARRVMGSIDTDPASSAIANQTVQAETFYTVEDDGLTKPWAGNVWMNPPYAQPLIEEFSTALVTRWKDSEISQACVLVNNATDTKWFQRLLRRAAFICFPTSRVKFLDPNGSPVGSPLQGQAILYLGEKGEDFSKEFSSFGGIVKIVRIS